MEVFIWKLFPIQPTRSDRAWPLQSEYMRWGFLKSAIQGMLPLQPQKFLDFEPAIFSAFFLN